MEARRDFYRKQGNALRNARRHNVPVLEAADLKVLGVDKAPRRLSQECLGKLVGCSRQVVGKYENGRGYDHFLYVSMLRYVLPEKPQQQKGRQ